MKGQTFAVRILAFAGLLLSTQACQESHPDQWPLTTQQLSQKAPSSGEASYLRYCIGCHGADGRGNSGLTGADFTAEDSPLKTRSDAELAQSVRDGKRGASAVMPAHSPVLTDEQIAAVVSYVRSRFQPQAYAP